MSKRSQWRDKVKKLKSAIEKYINDTGFWVRAKNYQQMLEEMKSVDESTLPEAMRSGAFKELRERGMLTMQALINNYATQAALFKMDEDALAEKYNMDIHAVQNEIDRLVEEANKILAGYEKITADSEKLMKMLEAPASPTSDEKEGFSKVFSRPKS